MTALMADVACGVMAWACQVSMYLVDFSSYGSMDAAADQAIVVGVRRQSMR
jgi:hypothetical protein